MKKENKKTIFLTGGGTGGSVSPLLAVKKSLEKHSVNWAFVWVGTRNGVEREMIKQEKNISFVSIPSGKLRRYFSWRNFVDPFKLIIAFFCSVYLLFKKKPDLVLSAGSFVSVPVAWAAWFFRVPVLIHQQDLRPGLANKLMAPVARVVTVAFASSLKDYGAKAKHIGNPLEIDPGQGGGGTGFALDPDSPVILITGGGTGSLAINSLVEENIDDLLEIGQIFHITGRDKKVLNKRSGYFVFPFLERESMFEIIRRADVVVSRAGLGSLTELSFLGKPSILIPLPGTHQEDNAQEFKNHEAALVLDQRKLSGEEFKNSIKSLVEDESRRRELSQNIQGVVKPGAEREMLSIIRQIVK